MSYPMGQPQPMSQPPPGGQVQWSAHARQEPPVSREDVEATAPPDPMTDDDAWYALHDRDKVEYSQSTLGEVLAFLDAKLDEIDQLRIEVEDPEGYIRFTIGANGRLMSLFIHEAARTQLTNLEMEQKFSAMLTTAYESWATTRAEITNTPMRWSPPRAR